MYKEESFPEIPVFEIWKLIIGLFLALIFGGVTYLLSSIMTNSFLIENQMSDYTRLFIVQSISQGVFLITILLILIRIIKKDSSLSKLLRIQNLETTMISLVVGGGCAIVFARYVISKALTGEFDIPPTGNLNLHWFLALSISLAIYAILTGVVEEVFYRGLVYISLRKRFSSVVSISLASIIFTASHFHYISNIIGMLFVATFGILSTILFEYRRNLTYCILFHLSTNGFLWISYYTIYMI